MSDEPKLLSSKANNAMKVALDSAQADKIFTAAIGVTSLYCWKLRKGFPLKQKQRQRLQGQLKELSEFNGKELSRFSRKRIEAGKAVILLVLSVSKRYEKLYREEQKETSND